MIKTSFQDRWAKEVGGTGGWNPLRRLYCMSKKATSENDRGGSAVDSSKPTAAEGSSAVAVEREL